MKDSLRAEELLGHLLTPLFSHPDEMELNVIEGSATVIVELKVHEDDSALLLKDEEALLTNVQQVLTVASQDRKFSLELLAQ
jgi:predicted RNA-binding protein YlqC (UPF0109 family)